ncbi:MAG: nitroreductase family protein [Gammaproteobacteria bacterium]|nr:nitroreductase family protein [Gammaproteobacteria bacterium]
MTVYQELAPAIDVNEFRKVVESRRSVRRFTDEEVPQTVIDDCLDMAMLVPNSSNLQPWEFYVVRSPELKAKLAEACLGQNAATTANVLIPIIARTNTWKKNSLRNIEYWPEETMPKIVRTYYSKVAPIHYNQGPLGALGLAKKAAGLIAGLKRAVPRGPYSISEMKAWAVKSTALAAENMMLGFRAHGFDTCPMEGFDERRVRKLLKLPDDAIVTMILGVGRRAPNGIYHRRYRFPREEFVHYL